MHKKVADFYKKPIFWNISFIITSFGGILLHDSIPLYWLLLLLFVYVQNVLYTCTSCMDT